MLNKDFGQRRRLGAGEPNCPLAPSPNETIPNIGPARRHSKRARSLDAFEGLHRGGWFCLNHSQGFSPFPRPLGVDTDGDCATPPIVGDPTWRQPVPGTRGNLIVVSSIWLLMPTFSVVRVSSMVTPNRPFRPPGVSPLSHSDQLQHRPMERMTRPPIACALTSPGTICQMSLGCPRVASTDTVRVRVHADNRVQMKIRVADYFCGCGGTSVGLQVAGMKILLGVDNDPEAEVTFCANFPDAVFLNSDARELRPRALEPIIARIRDYPLLFSACVPCQPYSQQNRHPVRRIRKLHDAALLDEFHRFVAYFAPEYIFLENVPGMQKVSRRTGPFARFLKHLSRLDYEVESSIVECQDFGVPQKRQRLVLLASRLGPIEFPSPTHGTTPPLKPYSTVPAIGFSTFPRLPLVKRIHRFRTIEHGLSPNETSRESELRRRGATVVIGPAA